MSANRIGDHQSFGEGNCRVESSLECVTENDVGSNSKDGVRIESGTEIKASNVQIIEGHLEQKLEVREEQGLSSHRKTAKSLREESSNTQAAKGSSKQKPKVGGAQEQSDSAEPVRSLGDKLYEKFGSWNVNPQDYIPSGFIDELRKFLETVPETENAATDVVLESIKKNVNIDSKTIDEIFTWAGNMKKDKRAEYEGMLLRLAETKTGEALIKNIVALSLCSVGLPPVCFFYSDKKDSRCFWREGMTPVQINVKSTREKFVFVIKNGSELDFAGGELPPCCLMAHELGHVFLRSLMRRNLLWEVDRNLYIKTWLETAGKKLLRTKKTSYTFDSVPGEVLANHLSNKVTITDIINCEEYWYRKLLGGIVKNDNPSVAESAFMDMWNHGEYGEVINILPIRKIFGNDSLFCYSDGRIVKELFNKGNERDGVKFFKISKNSFGISNNNPPLGVDFNPDNPDGLVRFGHIDTKDFSSIYYDRLEDTERQTFKELTLCLLKEVYGQKQEDAFDFSVLPAWRSGSA